MTAVYHVTVYCPNGNIVSRPVLAMSAADAIAEREAEMGISGDRAEGFDVDVRQVADPDGSYARNLAAAERRRLDNERWR